MTGAAGDRLRVVVATPLEAELVERLRGVDERLDVVFEPELLPPARYPGDHRGADVIVSPHTAALSVHENERIVALFAENLRRWLSGEALLSRVDPTRAY